jgi:hypothetical protein
MDGASRAGRDTRPAFVRSFVRGSCRPCYKRPVDTPPPATRRRLGCGLAVLAGVGAIVAVGLYLGQRDQASKTPCQRYAEVMVRSLDNCHSGQNRNHAHHVAICEARVDPTPACLEKIEALSREACDALERGPSAAGAVCARRPAP